MTVHSDPCPHTPHLTPGSFEPFEESEYDALKNEPELVGKSFHDPSEPMIPSPSNGGFSVRTTLSHHSCPSEFDGSCGTAGALHTNPGLGLLAPAVDFGVALVGIPVGQSSWELITVADGRDETNEGFHHNSTQPTHTELRVLIIADTGFEPCGAAFNPPGVGDGEPAVLVTAFFDHPLP